MLSGIRNRECLKKPNGEQLTVNFDGCVFKGFLERPCPKPAFRMFLIIQDAENLDRVLFCGDRIIEKVSIAPKYFNSVFS